jgi:hypothetical protein
MEMIRMAMEGVYLDLSGIHVRNGWTGEVRVGDGADTDAWIYMFRYVAITFDIGLRLLDGAVPVNSGRTGSTLYWGPVSCSV